MHRIIKGICFVAFCLFAFAGCKTAANLHRSYIPVKFTGNFSDDYSIRYSISDTLFLQQPDVKYRILKWDTANKYIIAKNGNQNPSEAGLYTRIDYMEFENMQPYTWGFCFTNYKAASAEDAERTAAADRLNPMKGCGGFPFSRLKRD